MSDGTGDGNKTPLGISHWITQATQIVFLISIIVSLLKGQTLTDAQLKMLHDGQATIAEKVDTGVTETQIKLDKTAEKVDDSAKKTDSIKATVEKMK